MNLSSVLTQGKINLHPTHWFFFFKRSVWSDIDHFWCLPENWYCTFWTVSQPPGLTPAIITLQTLVLNSLQHFWKSGSFSPLPRTQNSSRFSETVSKCFAFRQGTLPLEYAIPNPRLFKRGTRAVITMPVELPAVLFFKRLHPRHIPCHLRRTCE